MSISSIRVFYFILNLTSDPKQVLKYETELVNYYKYLLLKRLIYLIFKGQRAVEKWLILGLAWGKYKIAGASYSARKSGSAPKTRAWAWATETKEPIGKSSQWPQVERFEQQNK